MTQQNKIIVVTQSVPTLRDMERFGVPYLASETRDVEVWDISRLVRRIKLKPEVENGNIRTLTSWPQVNRELKLLNPHKTFFILYLNLTMRAFPLFALLSHGGFKSMINNSNIPMVLERPESKATYRPNLFIRLFKLIQKKNLTFELIGNYLLRRLIHLLPISSPTYMFCGGLKSLMLGPYWKRCKIVWGHHLDYETARHLPNELPLNLIPGEYAVFLDNGTPFHTDNFTYGNSIPETSRPNVYYPSVNNLLRKIENTFGTQIVIAAHPRWKFKEMENPYENRTIIGLSTPLLVKHAKFVISHHSTAAAYAVMFRKPVIFIQSSTHTYAMVGPAAEIFGKKPYVPYKDEVIPESELIVNSPIYDDIFKKYISTHQETDLSNWRIIGDVVDKDLASS